MSKPLVVSIPHSLGKAEATRRITEGVTWARSKYGALASISTTEWTNSQMAFRVGVLGQSAEGTISVTETEATVSVQLPWLLARFADKAQALVQQQGQLLLAKK
jgi:hypothetical protein